LLKQYSADDNFGSPRGPSSTTSVKPVASRYDDLIRSKARKFGLEAALLKAMIHVESAFNPNAISPKGAGGLMQLMPTTAQRYGISRRFDPTESIEGGSRYMRDLLAMFDYDTRLALAAYNAGENAVTRYRGIPPYPETENYVEKVMRLRDQYRKGLVGT
jgi:soluble lytic murein transglycosylase-like protein